MGGIQSASFGLFWPSIAWFIIATNTYTTVDNVREHYFPDVLSDIVYFVALALLVAHFVIMIVKIVMSGKSFLQELKEPKNYLEMFLLLIGVHCMVRMGENAFDTFMCDEYKVYQAVHGIVYYLAIAGGLYLWVGEGKNFAVPEIMIIAMSNFNFACHTLSDSGAKDNNDFYVAISTLAYFIYLVLIIKCIIEQKSDTIDLLTGLSYTIIYLTSTKDLNNQVSDTTAYEIFLLWLILLIYVIINLVKCNIDYEKLVVQLTALCCIVVMYTRNGDYPGDKFGRKIYGVLTLIGAYFSLVCAVALVVLYIYLLIKGGGGSGGKGKQKIGGI